MSPLGAGRRFSILKRLFPIWETPRPCGIPLRDHAARLV
jgi:hypothetical protein